jgi:putative transposase
MIDRTHDLPIKRQAELLGISRGTAHYHPEPFSEANLRLMRRMGIQALYLKPNTSRKHPAHAVYPYLPRDTVVERANQAWALDITYIPMARGWVYLVAVLDWHSRRVLAHRVSITMEAPFCVEAFNEAVVRHGAPEIVNTDQGSQFSGADFVDAVRASGARQSVGGKGCWRDNVFVERPWRSVKYEEVYLEAYDSVNAARQSLAAYIDFYNKRRPHQAHDGQALDTRRRQALGITACTLLR